jgi:hypothetical protein
MVAKRCSDIKPIHDYERLVLVMTLSIIAGDAENHSVAPRSKPPAELKNTQTTIMKINLRLQDKMLTATLHDTPTAREFASMLPLTLTLEDYSQTEKISNLPKKLTRENAPAGADPTVGDIAYYAPWGNLAVFYKDFTYSEGLILLGKLDGGTETLSVPGSVNVTIELLGSDLQSRS